MAKVDNAEEVVLDVHDAAHAAYRTRPINYSYYHMTAEASATVINANDCLVHSVTVGTTGDAAGTLALYDASTTAGTAAASALTVQDPLSSGTTVFDAYLDTGLVIKTTGATAKDVTVTYVDI